MIKFNFLIAQLVIFVVVQKFQLTFGCVLEATPRKYIYLTLSESNI